jgi:hypothetical protein
MAEKEAADDALSNVVLQLELNPSTPERLIKTSRSEPFKNENS